MPPENKKQNKAVQTYASDMAEVIGEDKAGLLKKIIHQEEERDREKSALSPESFWTKTTLAASWVLLLVSFGIILFFFVTKKIGTLDVPPQFAPMIFADKTDFLEISELKKEEVIQTITSAVLGSEENSGGVEAIYLTENKNIIGIERFAKILEANFIFPEDKKISDNFLMGIVNNESKDFFILLRVSSLEDVFVSMREWEIKMLTDLGSLFGVSLNANTKDLFTKSFEDGYIQNKNARVLYDENGNTVIMYVYLRDDSVLVTNSESAAKEVGLRLSSSKIKK